MVQSQMNSIAIVDEVMRDLQEHKKKEVVTIDKELEHMKLIQKDIEYLNKEKEDFSVQQKTLT